MSNTNTPAEITVPVAQLEKTAVFVDRALPLLQQQEAEKAAWAQNVPNIVDALIEAGEVKQEQRDIAIRNLTDGGLTKSAELLPYLASKIRVAPMGRPHNEKRASVTGPARKESDEIWERGMMGR